MKKKTLLTSMLLAVALATVSAKPRTIAQLLGAAQKVLSGTSLTKSVSVQDLQVLKSESQLTVIGYENGACAIIANDDQFDAVLGYTDKPLTGDPAPGFLWWLETMNASLESQLAEGTIVKATESNRKYSRVDPLVTTTWNQGAPYNNLCPQYTSNGVTTRYVTGCVATAMAQVMAYNKWPETGNKSISYTYTDDVTGEIRRLTANPGKTNYDYANMLDAYTSGNYNDAQATAVATLMYHCGLSVKMQYTVDGSGSMVYDACSAVRRNFRYPEYTPYYYRDVMSSAEWMNLIYREIDDACPVLYAGASSGGHCFVLDGYNESGQVHVNWGWGGSGDGFFTVSSLNGYSSQQQMVLMRKPDDTRVNYSTYRSLFGAMSALTMAYRIDHVNATGAIYNMDVDAFTGELGLMATSLSTGETTALSTRSLSSVTLFSGLSVDIDGETAGLADGEYRVYLATKSTKETDWQPIRTSDSYRNSYLMTKKGDGVSLTAERSNAGWMTGIGDIKVNKSTAATTVRVYDTTGRQVYSAPASTFSLNDVPASGLLIVKQGVESKKVMK